MVPGSMVICLEIRPFGKVIIVLNGGHEATFLFEEVPMTYVTFCATGSTFDSCRSD